MRVISLRCNGLISAVKQGLTEWIASKDADIICLQDVRVREFKVMGDSRFCPEGFDAFYFEGDVIVMPLPSMVLRLMDCLVLLTKEYRLRAQLRSPSRIKEWITRCHSTERN